jgi:hypothetical protein
MQLVVITMNIRVQVTTYGHAVQGIPFRDGGAQSLGNTRSLSHPPMDAFTK